MTDATQDRVHLIERNTQEIVTAGEIAHLLESGAPLQHYIGFEISGLVHLGTGLISMAKVRDLMAAGVTCRVFLADWHTWINDKLGGNRDVIRDTAVSYFAEAMKASLLAVGGNPAALEVVLASDFYASAEGYWETVIEVSKHTSLARMQRSITIMGRSEGDSLDFAKLIYPAMQAADIFAQGVTIAHAGMDQRKAHVIARDTALHMATHPLKDGSGATIKPIALHHPLILGLRKPPTWPIPQGEEGSILSAMKMSKSDPGSAVFVHDTPDAIRSKISKAFCPPDSVTFNPILDWAHRLVMEALDRPFEVRHRDGGRTILTSRDEMDAAYMAEKLHPGDLKTSLADVLIDALAPVRAHFEDPQRAAALERTQDLVLPKGRRNS